jgi:hypothetical protein
MGDAASVETIMAKRRSEYLASVQRWQNLIAATAAARPRDIATYRRFLDSDPLLFRVQRSPSDPTLCWPILRELCAWRRFARTRAGRAHTGPAMGETAAILIRAELRRRVAARRFPQALAAE